MGLSATTPSPGVYSDHIYTATDLSRRTVEVLNDAIKSPVTISRNGQLFALVTRERAAQLFQVQSASIQVVEFLEIVLNSLNSSTIPDTHAWINAFDSDEKRAMCGEVIAAARKALSEEGDWISVTDIIHEWRESGLAMLDGALREALDQPHEPESIEHPHRAFEPSERPEPDLCVES